MKLLSKVLGWGVNSLTNFIRAFGPARLAAMLAVAALMLGFFTFIILRWNSPHMVTMFSDLPVRDSARVVKELERAGISYELKFDGTTIQVPSNEVARLRMRLAEQGLPSGGGVGYEIFDKSEVLGTTSFVQNINHLRAMEGELARSINEIDRVDGTRVHLVMPERQLFAHDKQEPTASIVLKLRGELEQSQVKAIQHLVASAVPGMKPGAVSIVDEAGRLLATGRSDDEASASVFAEKAQGHEVRLRQEIEGILTRVVGPGRAKVQVATELDWNRVTQTQDTFDPESRAVRSTQTRGEKNQNGKGGGGAVTAGNSVPGGEATGSVDAQNQENSEKNDETVNYEVSRTSRTEVLEAGRIKRISVAVLIDGIYKQEGDKLNYTPRPQEELDRIGSLVRSAIGFDEKRGDKVEVVNLQFADAPKASAEPAAEGGFLSSFTMEDYFRIAEMGIIFLLGTLMVLFGVRPLLRSALAPSSGTPAFEAAHAVPAVAAQAGHAAASPQQHAPQQMAAAQRFSMPGAENPTSKALESAMAAGSLHKDSVVKVGELVRENPKEAAAVLRSWIDERAA